MDEHSQIGRVLCIAGSDSSGGAGVQADIKTCAAFGAYSATVITAVTAQNTQGVRQVEFMPAELVRAQIKSVMDDIGVDVIKIGMLGTESIVKVVAEEIAQTEAFVVLDPVMIATSGDRLLESAALEALKTQLIPFVDVLTPNVPEAVLLSDEDISAPEDLSRVGEKLLDMGLYAVLMKGGHLKGKTVVDVLVSDQGANMMTGPRLQSRHTHGTGCTLASAVAAGLALGVPLDEAVLAARDFVFEAIKMAPKLGAGHGPLNHGLVSKEADIHPNQDSASNPFAVLKDL